MNSGKSKVWTLAILGGIAAVALGGCSRGDKAQATGSSSHETAGNSVAVPSPGSLREIHLALEIELGSTDGARTTLAKLEDVARSAGGFVQLSSSGRDEGRSHLVLRLPPGALSRLRIVAVESGAVARDEETATDVTDAISDLDARLRAGRAEESRLLALVAERTGSVADVLAAERAIADVRERIERLDAESHASHGRVDLATVDVWLLHPATGNGERSVGTRLVTAAKDGANAAGELSLGIATMTLRAAPSVTLLGLLAATFAVLVRRWRGRRVLTRAS